MAPPRRFKTRKVEEDKDDEEDISQLRKPITLHGKPIEQILNSIHYGSPELRNLLLNECDMILECKACRALFRDLPNFISHKRRYCSRSAADNNHFDIGRLPEERVVFVNSQHMGKPEQSSANTLFQNLSSSRPCPESSLTPVHVGEKSRRNDSGTTTLTDRQIHSNSNPVIVDVRSVPNGSFENSVDCDDKSYRSLSTAQPTFSNCYIKQESQILIPNDPTTNSEFISPVTFNHGEAVQSESSKLDNLSELRHQSPSGSISDSHVLPGKEDNGCSNSRLPHCVQRPLEDTISLKLDMEIGETIEATCSEGNSIGKKMRIEAVENGLSSSVDEVRDEKAVGWKFDLYDAMNDMEIEIDIDAPSDDCEDNEIDVPSDDCEDNEIDVPSHDCKDNEIDVLSHDCKDNEVDIPSHDCEDNETNAVVVKKVEVRESAEVRINSRSKENSKMSSIKERPRRKRNVPVRNVGAVRELRKTPRLVVTAKRSAKLTRDSVKGKNSKKSSLSSVRQRLNSINMKKENGHVHTKLDFRRGTSWQKFLNEHYSKIKKLMNENKLICLGCDKSFFHKNSLKRHIWISHMKVQRFECKACGRKDFEYSELRRHITITHPHIKNAKDWIISYFKK